MLLFLQLSPPLFLSSVPTYPNYTLPIYIAMAVDEKSGQISHYETDYVTGDISHEHLDSQVHDDHGDSHRSALEDIEPDQ